MGTAIPAESAATAPGDRVRHFLRRIVPAALVMLAACVPTVTPRDPSCHWDCFPWTTCVDGVVTSHGGGAIPCAMWTGECPSWELGTCRRGCSIDPGSYENHGGYDHIATTPACEENRPKRAGDPCSAPEHCLPTPATLDDAGTPKNTYLACSDAGTCDPIDPPVIEGWGEPCGSTNVDRTAEGGSGYLLLQSCPGRWCAYVRVRGESCVRQGCTGECADDHECAPGATCQPMAASARGGVCRPGRAFTPPIAFECPPE